MKYPTLLAYENYDSLTNTTRFLPIVFDLDIENIDRFFKTLDGFTCVQFKNEKGFYKLMIRFWDFMKEIKEKNNLNISLKELTKLYDKDSLDDMLLNGI